MFFIHDGDKSFPAECVCRKGKIFSSMAAFLRHFSHYFWYSIHFVCRQQEFVKGSKYLSAFWLQNEGLEVLRVTATSFTLFRSIEEAFHSRQKPPIQSATFCCEERMFIIPRPKFSRSERKLRSPLCNLRIIGMCQCERLSEELIKWPSKNERWKQSAWEGERTRHIFAVVFESKLLLIEYNSGWQPAGTNLGQIRGKEGQWW